MKKSREQKEFYNREFKTIASKRQEENIRKFYFKKILSILHKNLQKNKKMKILEVGCGNGCLMEKMQNHFVDCDLSGFDISEENIDSARSKGLNVYVDNADDLKNKEKYDLIYGTAILHHLEDIQSFFDRISQNLNTGSAILFGAEPEAYQILYILWHKVRKTWEIEKGVLQIKQKRIRKYLSKNYNNIQIEREGNAFAYSSKIFGSFWNITRLSKIPFLNDLYIYAEKK